MAEATKCAPLPNVPLLLLASHRPTLLSPRQYRLCPKDEELTEACFQRMPLPFDRTKQALLWNNGTRLPLAGVFVDEGTTPAGSTCAPTRPSPA